MWESKFNFWGKGNSSIVKICVSLGTDPSIFTSIAPELVKWSNGTSLYNTELFFLPQLSKCQCLVQFQKLVFLYLLSGLPMANFGSLLRGQSHSPDVNHCIFINFWPEGHQERRNEVGSQRLAEAFSLFWPGFQFNHNPKPTRSLSKLLPQIRDPITCKKETSITTIDSNVTDINTRKVINLQLERINYRDFNSCKHLPSRSTWSSLLLRNEEIRFNE